MKLKTKELTICALFAALIAVGAFIKIDIPLPLYTMHFTFQWFFVLMAGLLLGARLGTISVFVYLCIGLMGVPVFAAGGGIAYVFRPGFGFLLGFLVAAFLMGYISQRMRATKFYQYMISAAIGMIAYYGVGATYFYLIKNFYQAVPVSWSVVIADYCLITVLPDFILCVCAASCTVRMRMVVSNVMLAESK